MTVLVGELGVPLNFYREFLPLDLTTVRRNPYGSLMTTMEPTPAFYYITNRGRLRLHPTVATLLNRDAATARGDGSPAEVRAAKAQLYSYEAAFRTLAELAHRAGVEPTDLLQRDQP
jgi:hypothetical protein